LSGVNMRHGIDNIQERINLFHPHSWCLCFPPAGTCWMLGQGHNCRCLKARQSETKNTCRTPEPWWAQNLPHIRHSDRLVKAGLFFSTYIMSFESKLVPYVDLIIRPGHRNRSLRRSRSPSFVVETPESSPRKRSKLQKDDSLGERLSSKVYKFYSWIIINRWTDVSANPNNPWATGVTYSVRVYIRRTYLLI
jgi:hypothetical protein